MVYQRIAWERVSKLDIRLTVGYVLFNIMNALWLLLAVLITPIKSTVKMIPYDIRLLLERTAALDEYAIFTVVAGIILKCRSALLQLSKHSVITLDIVYLITLLILIMYHILKEPHNLLSRSI